MRTYAGGGGVNERRTGAHKGGGGSEIGDFSAYVLYGCPLTNINRKFSLIGFIFKPWPLNYGLALGFSNMLFISFKPFFWYMFL